MVDKLLTISETAEYLGVSKKTVYALIKAGALSGVRVGARWRFRHEDIESYLMRNASGNGRGTNGKT